ncbi:hypothetical protein [Neisseria dentiae]|uniref:hypothetical protein n=1 Tax=Neisseria dentiae TaxID=194197 RepID=UPI00117C1F97|nr:hypothetical protein [Neisseria dentiae]QMT45215.1 hypothetical protein H3L92_12600 [Neisseria dentiae]
MSISDGLKEFAQACGLCKISFRILKPLRHARAWPGHLLASKGITDTRVKSGHGGIKTFSGANRLLQRSLPIWLWLRFRLAGKGAGAGKIDGEKTFGDFAHGFRTKEKEAV